MTRDKKRDLTVSRKKKKDRESNCNQKKEERGR